MTTFGSHGSYKSKSNWAENSVAAAYPAATSFSLPNGTDGGVFNIDEVLTGQASLSNGITAAIQESLCDP